MTVVAKSPLKVRFSGLHSKFSLSQPEPGQPRLLPNLGVRVLAWTLCVLGWPLLILALIVLLSRPTFEQVVGVVILLVFVVPFSFGSGTALPAFSVRPPNGRSDDPALLATRPAAKPLSVLAVLILVGLFLAPILSSLYGRWAGPLAFLPVVILGTAQLLSRRRRSI